VALNGGKHYLAKRIVSLMPPHLHYVEPYAGGLAVLLERDPNDEKLWVSTDSDRRGVSEVVNDIDKDLTNFWTVLQYPITFAAFHRHVSMVPLSRPEFDSASEELVGDDEDFKHCGGLSVARAVRFFVSARQSRAGTFKGFTSLTRSRTRRGINGNASEWLGAVEGLPAVHARLQPVVIECMEAVDLIRREDTKDTLFYCDPPYLHETRVTTDAYAHEMTVEQHITLLDTLCWVKGKFILSGYRSDLYDAKAQQYRWRRVDIDMPNNTAGGDSKRRMTECLWMNY
jgi:DNA adenine methylase